MQKFTNYPQLFTLNYEKYLLGIEKEIDNEFECKKLVLPTLSDMNEFIKNKFSNTNQFLSELTLAQFLINKFIFQELKTNKIYEKAHFLTQKNKEISNKAIEIYNEGDNLSLELKKTKEILENKILIQKELNIEKNMLEKKFFELEKEYLKLLNERNNSFNYKKIDNSSNSQEKLGKQIINEKNDLSMVNKNKKISNLIQKEKLIITKTSKTKLDQPKINYRNDINENKDKEKIEIEINNNKIESSINSKKKEIVKKINNVKKKSSTNSGEKLKKSKRNETSQNLIKNSNDDDKYFTKRKKLNYKFINKLKSKSFYYPILPVRSKTRSYSFSISPNDGLKNKNPVNFFSHVPNIIFEVIYNYISDKNVMVILLKHLHATFKQFEFELENFKTQSQKLNIIYKPTPVPCLLKSITTYTGRFVRLDQKYVS